LAAAAASFFASRGVRELHLSAVRCFPREGGKRLTPEEWEKKKKKEDEDEEDDEYDLDTMPEFEADDSTSYGHMLIHEQKRVLKYLRLIERDGPALRQLRMKYEPPTAATPLIVRAVSYSGEQHPVLAKRVVVSAISQLPLQTPEAIHKFKLMAGPRWCEEPPRDSGIGQKEHEEVGKHGYIKVSCEDFPDAQMNLKWISDVINNLIQESNESSETFKDIPLDTRHLRAKLKKNPSYATFKDFPKEWLPQPIPEVTPQENLLDNSGKPNMSLQ